MVLPNRHFSRYSSLNIFQEEIFETATNQSITTVGKHLKPPYIFGSSSTSATMSVETLQPLSANIPLPAQVSPPVPLSHISSNGYYGFIQFHQDHNAAIDNSSTTSCTMDIEEEDSITTNIITTPADKRKRSYNVCGESDYLSHAKRLRITGTYRYIFRNARINLIFSPSNLRLLPL